MSDHGTNSLYASGCRCAECREAHTEYAREFRAGERRTVDAEPIRRWLLSREVTMADIAEMTGVNAQTLRAIRNGIVDKTNREVYEAVEPWM